MEVFLQRLEQEHGASVITTAPTVPYTLDLPADARLDIENPSQARRGRLALSPSRRPAC
jgi:translation elongation factor EF-4